MNSVLSTLRRRVRQDGVLPVCWLAIYRLARKLSGLTIVHVFEIPVSRRDCDAKSPVELTQGFRWLTPSDVVEAAGELEGLLPPTLANRIEAGVSRCLGLLASDASAWDGFLWVAGAGFPPEWIYGPHVELDASTAYIYNAATQRTARGRGVFQRLLAEASRVLSYEGVRVCFVTVECANRASLRAMSKTDAIDRGLRISIGMPFGMCLKRSSLGLPECKKPESIRAEDDRL